MNQRRASGDYTDRRLPQPDDGRDVHANRTAEGQGADAKLHSHCERRRKPLPVEISFMNEGAGWKLAH